MVINNGGLGDRQEDTDRESGKNKKVTGRVK